MTTVVETRRVVESLNTSVNRVVDTVEWLLLPVTQNAMYSIKFLKC